MNVPKDPQDQAKKAQKLIVVCMFLFIVLPLLVAVSLGKIRF